MNANDIAKIVRIAGKQAVVTVLATLRARTENYKVAEAEAFAALQEEPKWLAWDKARAERLRLEKETKETEATVHKVAATWPASTLPDGITQRKAPEAFAIDTEIFNAWLQKPGNLSLAIENGLIAITPKAEKFAAAVKVEWASKLPDAVEARIASKLPGAVEGKGSWLRIKGKKVTLADDVSTGAVNVEL